VVYRATEPGKAVFYGGTRITGFEPVTDPAILARLPEEARGKVLRCDLRAQGIDDYGQLAVRGFAQPASPPTLELFVDGQPMTLARWPNDGLRGHRPKLVEPGSRAEGKPSVFEYLDDRHERWTQAEDPWLFGYFRYLWADATIRVSRIDTDARTVICDQAYQYGRRAWTPGKASGTTPSTCWKRSTSRASGIWTARRAFCTCTRRPTWRPRWSRSACFPARC
jgi:hypothetical protein